jgi:hypothetical protein
MCLRVMGADGGEGGSGQHHIAQRAMFDDEDVVHTVTLYCSDV